jgi:hypothetical protein
MLHIGAAIADEALAEEMQVSCRQPDFLFACAAFRER